MSTEYPEHEKLKALGDEKHHVQDFIDWLLGHSDLELARYSGNTGWVNEKDEDGTAEVDLDDVLYPARVNAQGLMSEYFEIDLGRLEEEKQEMLAKLQADAHD